MQAAGWIRRTFENRSGRVIASTRMVMGLLFALALWIDPAQPVRDNGYGHILLFGYLALSAILLIIAWRSWWFDQRLALPAFIIDGAAFLLSFYFTESIENDFVSPFLAFFVYLMLAANSRWGWRATGVAAGALGIGFLIDGWLLRSLDLDIDLIRFARRISYMSVMSLALVWFGLRNAGIRVQRFELPPENGSTDLFPRALAYAMHGSRAKGAAIAWADEEEPRIHFGSAGLGAPVQTMLAPDAIDLSGPEFPLLFDTSKHRLLEMRGPDQSRARPSAAAPGLPRYLGLEEGLCIPLRGTTGSGQLVLTGIGGMCADDTRLGLEIGREVSLAIDREQLASITREAAIMRLRGSIARDLHDSVAQSLAGASFRLEALRGLVRRGGDPLAELDAIHAGLAGEQQHVRTMINRLRQEEISPGERDLAREIAALTAPLSQQWGIQARFSGEDRPMAAPALLVFEVQQLVREAVANAVRHGSATSVDVSLGKGPQEFVLTIADNGAGFSGPKQTAVPRSLAERVGALGGTLVISSREGDTRIAITLPLKGRP